MFVCDKRDRPTMCFVVISTFTKRPVYKKGEVRRKNVSNKIIVTLVTQVLPSAFLSHPIA